MDMMEKIVRHGCCRLRNQLKQNGLPKNVATNCDAQIKRWNFNVKRLLLMTRIYAASPHPWQRPKDVCPKTLWRYSPKCLCLGCENLLQEKNALSQTHTNLYRYIVGDQKSRLMSDARAIYFIDCNDNQKPTPKFIDTYLLTIAKFTHRKNLRSFKHNFIPWQYWIGTTPAIRCVLDDAKSKETNRRSSFHTWSHDADFRLTIFLLLTVYVCFFFLFFYLVYFASAPAHTCIQINAVYERRVRAFLPIYFFVRSY